MKQIFIAFIKDPKVTDKIIRHLKFSFQAERLPPFSAAEPLSATIKISNKGSDELPLWKVQKGLPSWLTVTVSKNGKNQTLPNTISTSGLKKGLYHVIVRADNTEPVSGKPMSAFYYDVDLEISK